VSDEPARDKVVYQAFGSVTPTKQVLVSPKIGGEVVELNGEEGKIVRRGDILARLDDSEVKADLEVAKARFEVAKARLARIKVRGNADDTAIAEAEFAVAKAEVGKVQNRLEALVVHAPITGTILVKKAEVGGIVNPQAFALPATICEMADLRELEVEVDVPAEEIGKVRVGQACRIQLDAYPKTIYKGKLARLIPVANRSKGAISLRVKLEVPDSDTQLRPELRAVVKFLGAN
jgi:RND family efflux transporter MFP subunit